MRSVGSQDNSFNSTVVSKMSEFSEFHMKTCCMWKAKVSHGRLGEGGAALGFIDFMISFRILFLCDFRFVYGFCLWLLLDLE